SLMLVFLLSMGEFSVPNFLRFQVLPVLSFTEFTASYNFGSATAAAAPLAALAFAGVLLETAFFKGRVFTYRGALGALRMPLGTWKPPLMVAVVAFCLL